MFVVTYELWSKNALSFINIRSPFFGKYEWENPLLRASTNKHIKVKRVQTFLCIRNRKKEMNDVWSRKRVIWTEYFIMHIAIFKRIFLLLHISSHIIACRCQFTHSCIVFRNGIRLTCKAGWIWFASKYHNLHGFSPISMQRRNILFKLTERHLNSKYGISSLVLSPASYSIW